VGWFGKSNAVIEPVDPERTYYLDRLAALATRLEVPRPLGSDNNRFTVMTFLEAIADRIERLEAKQS
jgi:hypothetical protein